MVIGISTLEQAAAQTPTNPCPVGHGNSAILAPRPPSPAAVSGSAVGDVRCTTPREAGIVTLTAVAHGTRAAQTPFCLSAAHRWA